ncbi:hypothetical protein ATI53_102014 [Salipiger aestuarii]|uniref:Uncharacterized protein n=1 Tax=Salipiger aestuarii TaxID=568098 RepID=A0A327Y5T5_9RHOB|nr:hypothetical protein ATI53_102014 [Salipiger aestuarii]
MSSSPNRSAPVHGRSPQGPVSRSIFAMTMDMDRRDFGRGKETAQAGASKINARSSRRGDADEPDRPIDQTS